MHGMACLIGCSSGFGQRATPRGSSFAPRARCVRVRDASGDLGPGRWMRPAVVASADDVAVHAPVGVRRLP